MNLAPKVTQVFNLLYRRLAVGGRSMSAGLVKHAGYKPAIQQTGSLRYDFPDKTRKNCVSFHMVPMHPSDYLERVSTRFKTLHSSPLLKKFRPRFAVLLVTACLVVTSSIATAAA